MEAGLVARALAMRQAVVYQEDDDNRLVLR